MRLRRYKYLVLFIILLYTLYIFFGVGDYLHSKSFSTFDYPLNVDLEPLVAQVLSGEKPGVKPINYYPYRFLTNSGICSTVDKLDLLIVVKSATDHFENRMAIRQTYGQENVTPGRVVKILFFLGVTPHKYIQNKIRQEMIDYRDIIQMDFLDSYFNNTVKTMMSFRWVFEHCAAADYYLFTDDDMYISVPNLLDYVEREAAANSSFSGPSDVLYAGYMFKSGPHRALSSKWRVSLDEYPWNMWPPYITAGAYVLSNRALKVLYVSSLFVKHFRFDDIYLGIVAKKAGVPVSHCDKFYFYKKPYTKDGYRDVIASHGYGDRHELVSIWNEQYS